MVLLGAALQRSDHLVDVAANDRQVVAAGRPARFQCLLVEVVPGETVDDVGDAPQAPEDDAAEHQPEQEQLNHKADAGHQRGLAPDPIHGRGPGSKGVVYLDHAAPGGAQGSQIQECRLAINRFGAVHHAAACRPDQRGVAGKAGPCARRAGVGGRSAHGRLEDPDPGHAGIGGCQRSNELVGAVLGVS